MLRPMVNDLDWGIELRSIPEAKFVSPLVEISGSTPAYSVHKKALLACIAEGIGGDIKDEYEVIDAGQLGYCEAFDFKCAAKRTCDAWVVGGPIKWDHIKT